MPVLLRRWKRRHSPAPFLPLSGTSALDDWAVSPIPMISRLPAVHCRSMRRQHHLGNKQLGPRLHWPPSKVAIPQSVHRRPHFQQTESCVPEHFLGEKPKHRRQPKLDRNRKRRELHPQGYLLRSGFLPLGHPVRRPSTGRTLAEVESRQNVESSRLEHV